MYGTGVWAIGDVSKTKSTKIYVSVVSVSNVEAYDPYVGAVGG